MRRTSYLMPLAMIIMAVVALYSVSTRPRFQEYRKVDVVTLVASGLLVGVAVASILSIRQGRSDKR